MEYGDKFYKGNIEGSLNSAKEMVPLIFELLKPKKVVDMGCGIGAWLAEFKKKGCKIKGFDFNTANESLFLIDPIEEFQRIDLRKLIKLLQKYDLAICLETVEHLDEKFVDILIENLINMGDKILFSAAIPFQGGYNHLNEKWPSYWISKFEKKGYFPIDIRSLFWNNKKIKYYYSQNLILFVKIIPPKKNKLYPFYLSTKKNGFLNLVHPENYITKSKNLEKVKKVMPGFIRKFLIKKGY